MKCVLSMRLPYEAECRDDEQQRAEREKRNHQRSSRLVGDGRSHLHQFDDFLGQTFDSLLEPQDREDDIGEAGDLLNVSNLTHCQVDLNASACT